MAWATVSGSVALFPWKIEHTVQNLINHFNRPVIALTYAGAYLGIGSGVHALTCQEITRRLPSGVRRLDQAVAQRRPPARLPYLQAKVVCSEAAVRVTQDLMT